MADEPRRCNGCDKCCETVPVKEIGLASFTRCAHARDALSSAGPGCAIYAERPYSCRSWSCLWLKSPDLPDALRPDRCGVVIDEIVDVLRINGVEKPCAQIWVSRGHETDFDEPLIQSAILALIDKGLAVLWRLPPNADGRLMGRAIVRDGANWIGISDPVPADEGHNTLGSDHERLRRAEHLTKGLKL